MILNSVVALPALATIAYNAVPASQERLLSLVAFACLFIVGPYTSAFLLVLSQELVLTNVTRIRLNYGNVACFSIDFVLMPTNRKLLKWNETGDETAAKGAGQISYHFQF